MFESPNTVRADTTFEQILREAVPGKRVLEIGCGTGWLASRVAQFGAAYVLGLDISQNRIAQARQHEMQGPGGRSGAAGSTLLPFNDVSLPAGAISSLLLKKPDNLLLGMADRADTLLARQVAWLPARFCVAILVRRQS